MDEANPPGNLPVERSESREGVKSDQEEKQEEMNLKDLSWIKAAKDKKSLKKYDVEISTQEGKHKVTIPDEVLIDSTPLWD